MKTTQGLKEPFKSNLEGMIRAGDGAFYLLSGLRTYQEQYNLRVGRVPTGQEMNARYPGNPLTAVPGTSRHETGLAADLAGNLDRAHELSARFNIWFPLWVQMKKEYWHAEPKIMKLAQELVGQPPTSTPEGVIVDYKEANPCWDTPAAKSPIGRRLWIAGRGTDMAGYLYYFNDPTGVWDGPIPLGGELAGSVGIAAGPDGRLDFTGVGLDDGKIYHAVMYGDGKFRNWQLVGGQIG